MFIKPDSANTAYTPAPACPLLNAFDNSIDGKPLCIVANTIKGKGVSFMENNTLWHYRSPQGKEYEVAMNELENA